MEAEPGLREIDKFQALIFDPLEAAEDEAAAAAKADADRSGLLVVHGGAQACYVPALDEIRLPPKKSFRSVYDYYATAIHEGVYSTLHARRLDRKKRCRSSVPMSQAHIDNHAAYLKSWLKVVAADPMAIFSAVKGAEAMAGYMLGLERQRMVMDEHREWINEYERSME